MIDRNASIKTKEYPSGAGRIAETAVRSFSSRVVTWILTGVLFLGAALIAYPTAADYWNSFHQSRVIGTYADDIANMTNEDYKIILDEAHAYNDRLAEKGILWQLTDEEKKEYEKVLDISGTGVMGYINVPKIDVMLPIYHGTDDMVLQIAIGHLEGSSLPVGGETAHSMLSGHRGLPSAKLFTDLDKLKEGDTFTMTILNETLTYEVDHVWIVEPSELSHLKMENGKDYCTLITCTPYGINSHRLLVRAHRIENVNGDAMVVADALQIKPVFIAPFLAFPILIFLLIYVLIHTSVKRRTPNSIKDSYMREKALKVPEPGQEARDKDIEAIVEDVRRFVNSRIDSKEQEQLNETGK